MAMIADLIRKNRSCRRFYQDHMVTPETLKQLVDLARLSPSAANLQPLKYILCTTPEKNARVFSCLGWAAYLKDWPGPKQGERPAGYIIMLGDRETSNPYIGYEKASALAKEAFKSGKTIRELCEEQEILPEDDLKTALDPFRMTEPQA